MGAKGFPGKREESYRAGITTTTEGESVWEFFVTRNFRASGASYHVDGIAAPAPGWVWRVAIHDAKKTDVSESIQVHWAEFRYLYLLQWDPTVLESRQDLGRG